MKNHGQFTHEVKEMLERVLPAVAPATRQRVLSDVVHLSRMGLAPEAKGTESINRFVDYVYNSLDSLFLPDAPISVPIPLPAEEPEFEFSALSLQRSIRVFPGLMNVAKLALKRSTVDFGFTENQSRTEAEQRQKVRDGVSKTMESLHRIDPDTNYSYALDAVAYVDGKFSWDWDSYYCIAFAFDQAATELGFAKFIRWGGAWDRRLSDFGGRLELYKEEVEKYKERHPGKDFIDGPHFEWVR